MSKKWNVTFKFPQAIAAYAYQTVLDVEANNFGLAVNRAWAEVKTRKGVKGKRLKTAQITVTLQDGGSDDS